MRVKMWNGLILFSALTLTSLGAQASALPQSGKQGEGEHTARKEVASVVSIYRVSYKVNELENGKTVNSRSYVLMAEPGKIMNVRIGSRVPYSPGKDLVQYQDVGMDIDCTVGEQGASLLVNTTLSMNTVAGSRAVSSDLSNPVFNQLRLRDITPATLGKPAFVGALDDMASNRHYVIEVTVTEAK